MPDAGDLIGKYGRQYRYIKPLDSEPGTFRLATPEEGTPGGTPGGGTPHSIVGVDPIKAETTGISTKTTTVSLNIQSLPPRG